MFFPSHAVPMGLAGPMNNAKSSGSSGGTTDGINSHNVAGHSPLVSHHHWHRVPAWAYVLIGIAAFVILLFAAAFVRHAFRERRMALNQNRRFSFRSVAVKAAEIALFFWVVALLSRCLCAGRKRTTPSGGAVSSYRKVDNAREMTSANNNLYSRSMGYGIALPGPSGAAYGDGGSGNLDSVSEKYEPMSHASTGNIGSTGAKAVAASAPTADHSRSHSRSASTSAPYSPGSAFAFQQDTSYAPTNIPASSGSGPRHITPTDSPVPSRLPTPTAVTEPLMAYASSTYVPSHDSPPMY
ncbi:hypothetical protein SCUCBS95973_009910 [Sporothrix curviconia]|uniref:Integral membrane protein n=1 Tax=Sporothrix curviconia TaxID=1260050 RepID=A0ABP0D1B9_9PEZI